MVNALNSKRISKTLFFIIFLFYFAKLEIKTETIDLKDEGFSQIYSGNKYFTISPNFDKTNTNFLKIEIEANDDNEFALSYYKNSLEKRNQLSQSISKKAFIFLNQDQFNKEFSISVLFEYSSETSEYTLKISRKEEMELNVGEQYSFLVEEDKQEMIFHIKGKTESKYQGQTSKESKNYKLSAWAKGSLNFTIDLDTQNKKYNKEKKGFSAYIMEIKEEDEDKDFDYSFTLKGTKGDLIKVGSFLINKYYCIQTPITSKNMEIFGFFKEDVLEMIYFPINAKDAETIDFSFSKLIVYDSTIYQNTNLKNNEVGGIRFYQYKIEEGNKEQFYFFDFKVKNKPIINIYSPRILGGTYEINLIEKETVGLIPMKVDNYKYLTYQTTPEKGKYTASILKCNNYPFCIIEKSNITELFEYYSSSISYSKEEYGNITPISENQNMLLLTCEKDNCKIYVNMFTENNQVTIFTNTPFYRYIRSGSDDNFVIDFKHMKNQPEKIWFINIEILSEDDNLSVNPNFENYKAFSSQKKKVYEIKSNFTSDYSLQILSDKNRVYSIIIIEENEKLPTQVNYLLRNQDSNPRKIQILRDIYDELKLYYLGIFTLNCEIDPIIYNVLNGGKIDLLKKDKYYQDIKNYSDGNSYSMEYNVKYKNSDNIDKCYYGLSLFRYINETHKYDSIILPYNITYPFIFKDMHKKVHYMSLLSETDNDQMIDIKLFNETKYLLEIFLNNKLIKEEEISNSVSFKISSDEIKKVKTDNQPLKINFLLTESNNGSNSTIEVKIDKYTESNNDDNGNKKRNLIIIIGSVVSAILLIAVIILVIFVLKNKNKYDKLNDEVNKISFKENPINEDEGKNDDLLA